MKNRTIVFDATSSQRTEEWNGHLRVENTNLTKANVCEYYGYEIANYAKYDFDPQKKYRFLRSPDALKKAVSSFKERPILYLHKAADADKLDNSKVIGSTGSNPVFDFPYIKDSITIWDGDYIEAIKKGTQAELSASYTFNPKIEQGVFEGQPYDAIMTDIYVDHIALVEQGRAGPDVRVADSKQFHFKGNEMAKKLNKTGESILNALVDEFNLGRASDSNGQDIASIVVNANKTKRSMVPKVISSLLIGHSIANDEDTGRIEETVQKAMDEDTECKAKDSDDPVDTLEANDEDTEDKDKKTKVGDNEEGEANHKPTTNDSEESDQKPPTANDEAEKKKEAENRANDVALIEGRANDAAIKHINLYKQQVKDAREAEKIIRPIVGELSIVSDSAAEYYEAAINMVTGETPPKGTPVTALKFMVQNLESNKSKSKANDSAKSISKNDKVRFGATRLGSI